MSVDLQVLTDTSEDVAASAWYSKPQTLFRNKLVEV
jgi:hypothetical protein